MSSLRLPDAVALARNKLGDAGGPRFWRALEELADDAGFRRELAAALPQFAGLLAMDRRRFLQLLGASLAFGGLAACSGPPPEQIVPWVTPPPGVQPDVPQYFATTLACAGDVIGVLVESQQGRPTKIEGNPLHPASQGATGPLPQAAVLQLWDPDRSQRPLFRGNPASWAAFADDVASWPGRFANDGSDFHVVSGRIVSPTLLAQRQQWSSRWPGMHWYQHAPVAPDHADQAAMLAFGQAVVPRYHLEQADVILSLEGDFLGAMPGRVAYARAFAARRQPPGMNRLYVLEATPTLTGMKADHRWAVASASIALVALELAHALGVITDSASAPSGLSGRRLQALQSDLLAHRGRCVVIAGPSQPPAA